MSEMISFGAGVNSVAMTILLVNEGWRGPIVFADTGGEHPETYCYLEYFGRWLKEHELEIITISPETHSELYNDKRLREHTTLEEYCLWRGIIPLAMVKWCSVMFKGEPLDAWRNLNHYDVSLRGICADEPRRVKYNSQTESYPLVEKGINRQQCQRIIQLAGLEIPRKSGCFFCPGQPLASWRDLALHHSDLYDRAITLEENAVSNSQKWVTLRDDGPSLAEMRERRWKGMVEMDLSEWLPCACVL